MDELENSREVTRRWRGARQNGLDAVSARIACSKYRKAHPGEDFEVRPLDWAPGKFEVVGTRQAPNPAR